MSNGGSAPRILSIDDYFMTEHDVTVKDSDTGRTTTKTVHVTPNWTVPQQESMNYDKEFDDNCPLSPQVMKYEYEMEMEEIYRQSLLKSFKKQIDNLLFNFIILDSFNEKVEYFEDFWSYAKSKGFQVYTVEIQAEPNVCFKRNTHSRTLSEILRVSSPTHNF